MQCHESVRAGQTVDPCLLKVGFKLDSYRMRGRDSRLEDRQICKSGTDWRDKWVPRVSDILRLAAHLVIELITTMPDFSIARKVPSCRTVIYRNKRTEVVGVLEQLAGANAVWYGHGFPGHPPELASHKCSLNHQPDYTNSYYTRQS